MTQPTLTLSDSFDSARETLPPRSETLAAQSEAQPTEPRAADITGEPIADPSAIYSRLDHRRQRPKWIAPAAAAVVLIAGGGLVAFTLTGPHSAQTPKSAQVASNTDVAPTAPAPTAAPAAPAQNAPAKVATPPATSDRGEAASRHTVARKALAHPDSGSDMASAMPAAPVPYAQIAAGPAVNGAPSANGAAADVSATQPAPTPTAPQGGAAQTATPPVNPAAPSANGSANDAAAMQPPPTTTPTPATPTPSSATSAPTTPSATPMTPAPAAPTTAAPSPEPSPHA